MQQSLRGCGAQAIGYLLEAGIGDIQVVNLDVRAKKENRTEGFRKISPFQKVPALEDGDMTLFESGAILLYLGERCGQLSTPTARARAAAWVLFAATTLAQALLDDKHRAQGLPDVMGCLEMVLASQVFVEPGAFSVGDVAVGSILMYVPRSMLDLDFSPYPNVVKYMARPSVNCQAAKLYTATGSRGAIVEWYLLEAGIKDVEIVNLEMREKREHKTEAFRQINPFNKVPAFEEGDLKLFESGAILLYLAERCGQLSTPAARARAAAWVLLSNTGLTNSLFVDKFREKGLPDVMGSLERVLEGQEYMEPGGFSVSDVAVGAILMYVPRFLPDVDLSPFPNVVKYVGRLSARPAAKATVCAPPPPPTATPAAAPPAAAPPAAAAENK
ncbi:MAG: hypothetical protein WDW38_004709 [Sanguina aurantia]